MQSIIEELHQRVIRHPERLAIVRGGEQVGYAQLWTRIMAAAAGMANDGVVPGDRVLLAAQSVPEFAYGYFGAHLLGAVAVPLDPQAPPSRREEVFRRAAPKVGFGASRGEPESAVFMRDISELSDFPECQVGRSFPAIDEPADLLFTTGTTGRAKGVCLSHRNLAAAAAHINSVIRRADGDTEVLPLPLYHSFGLGRLRCNLIAGVTTVLVNGFRMPGEVFSTLARTGASGLCGVPAGFAILLRFGDRGLGAFAHQLRYVEIGSAPMPKEHKRALMGLLPTTELWMHYGLTEASRSVFGEFHRLGERLEAAGYPAPGVQVRIRGDDGADCQDGQTGTLWVRGDHVSAGYWNDPELTAATFVDGWLCTGDLARADVDGLIWLSGRKDDLVNVGGFKVSPIEVESVLELHPAVREAACIGVADRKEIAGQLLSAFLTLKPGFDQPDCDELAAWVAERLEPYKVPAEYMWIDSLPKTESGKLLRAVLRQQHASGR